VVQDATETFTEFARSALVKVRAGLVSAFGGELGAEATAEALAYGWEHWDEIRVMNNPTGYLYRVGRTHAVRSRRKQRRQGRTAIYPEEPVWVEPAMEQALRGLSERQRAGVSLVHGYGFTLQEVADLWGVRRSTVQWHVDRALVQLRIELGVDSD